MKYNERFIRLSWCWSHTHKLHGYITEEWQIKIMAVLFLIAHEKGLTFYAQPNCAYYYSCNFRAGPAQIILECFHCKPDLNLLIIS